jgi:hypothetical protein
MPTATPSYPLATLQTIGRYRNVRFQTKRETINGVTFGVSKVALADDDTAAELLDWENTEGVDVIVYRLLIDLTTPSTAACTVDFGHAATEILSDTLIDGLDVNAAAGVFDNIDDQGTNGQSKVKVPNGEFITGSVASGASADLAGYAYIFFFWAE